MHDPDALLEAAKSAYEQRSRQELEGTIATAEMFVDTTRDRAFDLHGPLGRRQRADSSSTRTDRIALVNAKLPNEFLSIVYLMDRGYSKDVATLMVRNMSDFALLDPVFYVKSVRTTIDQEGDGMFEIEINYVNRIVVSGDAA